MTTTGMSVALYGATGALGREIMSCLEEDAFPCEPLTLYGSAASEGEELLYGSQVLRVKRTPRDPEPVNLAILALPEDISESLLPRLLQRGIRVIDANPGRASGLTPDILVPSVNGEAVDPKSAYLGAPGQSAVMLAHALKPLAPFGLEDVVVTAMESASGQGQRGMEALSQEILDLYRKGEVGGGDEEDDEEEEGDESPHAHQLAFNAIPQVGAFAQGGLTQSESQLEMDIPRLLSRDVSVHATMVQAPWFSSHGLSVTVELEKEVTIGSVLAALKGSPKLEIFEGETYPMPFKMVGKDEVAIGRIRLRGRRLSLFIVGDNLRAGGALNIVAMARWILAGGK